MANTPSESPEEEAPLAQLSKGLLFLGFKQDVDKPEYAAVGRQTYEQEVIWKRHSYCSDLIRALEELKITAALTAEINEERQIGEKVYQVEEQVVYYNGIFLDHVHQIKDKLLRLIDHMAAAGPFPKPYKEPDFTKISRLKKKHEQLLKDAGLDDILDEWQKSGGTIAVILARRTNHHHFVSRLRYNEDFQKVQMARTSLQPISASHLSKYGKDYMTKLANDSLDRYKTDIIQKQTKAVTEIEASVNAIAEKLIKHFDIPIDPLVLAEITNSWVELQKSFDIDNEASLDKVQDIAKPLLDEAIASTEAMVADSGDELRAVYLIGSVGRGEFIPGTSDLNLVVIQKTGKAQSLDSELPITMTLVNESDFMTEDYKKQRFLVWSDGVLLKGNPYKFKSKDFPKPGGSLAELLNRDAEKRLKSLQVDIDTLSSPDQITLHLYSVKVAKIMLDYVFGVAMENKPFYSASHTKKIAHFTQLYPNDYLVQTLEQIYQGGRVRLEDLKVLTEAAIQNIKRTWPKLEALKDEDS